MHIDDILHPSYLGNNWPVRIRTGPNTRTRIGRHACSPNSELKVFCPSQKIIVDWHMGQYWYFWTVSKDQTSTTNSRPSLEALTLVSVPLTHEIFRWKISKLLSWFWVSIWYWNKIFNFNEFNSCQIGVEFSRLIELIFIFAGSSNEFSSSFGGGGLILGGLGGAFKQKSCIDSVVYFALWIAFFFTTQWCHSPISCEINIHSGIYYIGHWQRQERKRDFDKNGEGLPLIGGR